MAIQPIQYRFSFRRKRDNPSETIPEENDPKQIVVLPWVLELSPKLRKSFKSAGYKAVFKSSANLKTLLTSHNKSKLPPLNQPSVYMTACECGKKYVGETSMKTATRIQQHKKSIVDKKWDLTGVSDHAKNVGFDWKVTIILKTEEKRFERKVREALEIQLQQTSPHSDHGLNQDDGQYVTTSFWKPMFTHIREKTLQ